MATAIWPLTLPQVLLIDGFQSALPENVIRQPMGVGPAKVRRRDVAATWPVQGNINLQKEQMATLFTFFRSTLGDGALPFDWIDPITGTPVTFMFKTAPKYSALGNGWLRVALDLEVQP